MLTEHRCVINNKRLTERLMCGIPLVKCLDTSFGCGCRVHPEVDSEMKHNSYTPDALMTHYFINVLLKF